MKKSPIRYMGNKGKLIQKGLCDLFPSDINTMYDLFGGSGVVSLNTNANQYVLNELDKNIYSLYLLMEKEPNKIISEIKSSISRFDLPTFSTDTRRQGVTKELRDFYKSNYMHARETMNADLKPINIMTLMYYSMSTTIRINPNTGQYNMPFGNGYFIEDKHGEQIRTFHSWLIQKEVSLYNDTYHAFVDKPLVGDFVYLDPPYLNTTATYNENGEWGDTEQKEVMEFCDALNSRGVHFGMSNTLFNKGLENTVLKEWLESKGYKAHYFDNFDYCTFGTGRSETVEVYITNYSQ